MGWREGSRKGSVMRDRNGCSIVCAMFQKISYRKKRDDAICRETDGVCDPAAMKTGGEEQVAKRRRATETATSL